MTITYKPMKLLPHIQIPVLHKVVYDNAAHGPTYNYQRSYKEILVDAWLKENCHSTYYHSPGYLREKSIHFEDDKEACMFTLKWS